MMMARRLGLAFLLCAFSVAFASAQQKDSSQPAAIVQQTGGQDSREAITSQLQRWESVLASGRAITPQDLAAVRKLDEQIGQTPYKDLITRGALLLALYRDSLATKARSEEVAREIRDQAALMNRQSRQQTKETLAKVGFWTGIGATGLALVSGSLSSWAFNEFSKQSNYQVASDYFATGKISNIVQFSSVLAAVAGFGLATFELFGLYSTPVPPGSPMVVTYPSEHMTKEAKVAYLDSELKEYAKQLAGAQKARRIGTWSLLGGVAALVPTVVLALAENNAFSQYSAAGFTSAASGYQTQTNIFKWGAIATGTLAAVGFAGALTTYLFFPDPTDIEQTMSALSTQRDQLTGK